jgi:hypothetical protein
MDALDELVQALALRVTQRARLLVAACGVNVHVGHCEELVRVAGGWQRDGLVKSFWRMRSRMLARETSGVYGGAPDSQCFSETSLESTRRVRMWFAEHKIGCRVARMFVSDRSSRAGQ